MTRLVLSGFGLWRSETEGDFLRRKTRLDWRAGSTCMGMRVGTQ